MRTKPTILLALLMYGTPGKGYSQTVAPHILNAGGSTAVADGNTFELSFGEMMAIETVTDVNFICTQGVLQPQTTTPVLPITLLRFHGIKMAAYNQLQWTTSYESGRTAFELERSDDGQNFATIYQTLANGIVNGSSYNYNDSRAFSTKVFYRLRITENGGMVRYSAIVLLYQQQQNKWNVFPNPVNSGSFLQVSVQNAEPATNNALTILDAAGRKVYESRHKMVTGFQIISLPVNLPAGVYTLSITGFTKNSSQKIIVQ